MDRALTLRLQALQQIESEAAPCHDSSDSVALKETESRLSGLTEVSVDAACGKELVQVQRPAPTVQIKSLDKCIEEAPETKKIQDEEKGWALPPQKGTNVTRAVHNGFFSRYRMIFAFVFAANLLLFIGLAIRAQGVPSMYDVNAATSANLLVAILFRQENFVNLAYEVASCAPHWFPLAIRKRLAKVFHYGGLHSGCGVAASLWYLLYTVLACELFARQQTMQGGVNMAASLLLVIMFTLLLIGAYPSIRRRYHNTFEAAHRYAGWTALVMFWIHTVIATDTTRDPGTSLGMAIVTSAGFWLLVITTSCTLLSWSRLRLHKVRAEVLSDRAVRLYFDYPMKPFYGIKVSDRPLQEWHAFATIPEPDHKSFSVVVSNAGDWTSRAIKTPPTKLWVRGSPMHGLLYTTHLFKKIVLVATGSGIGPCLSMLGANHTPRRILWSTPDPETYYGPKLIKAVTEADPQVQIWNTRSMGRPDMLGLSHKLYVESGAEAVFIISNPKLTQQVVFGLETRGIPAYGAIFDS